MLNSCISCFEFEVGDGKCCANSVWTSLWSQTLGSNGDRMPKSNHFALGSSSPPYTSVLVVRTNTNSHGPITNHSREGPNLCKGFNPSTLCICHKLSPAEIPSSTEHSEPFGTHVRRSFPPSHSSHLVGGWSSEIWATGSCSYSQLFLVVACDCIWGLHCCKPQVQGNLDWLLLQSLQGYLAIFQVHCCLFFHALVCLKS